MGVSFTLDQQKVIDARQTNLLVAAAAGSGKTAVLVERIIQKITEKENPVDVDRILVVTFTNAAAAQMRERIQKAIQMKLEENPEDENLLKQNSYIHNAQITTIHSFCLYLLRNHFHEIDLDPGFRIGDEGELLLLQKEIMKKMMEEANEKKSESFLECKAYFAPKVMDKKLTELIMKLYQFSMSYPFPAKWLLECKHCTDLKEEKELEKNPIVLFFVRFMRDLVGELEVYLEKMEQLMNTPDGPYMYEKAYQADCKIVDALRKCNSYHNFYETLRTVSFEKLSPKKDDSVSVLTKDAYKLIRTQFKSLVEDLKNKYFFASGQEIIYGIQNAKVAVDELIDLTLLFMERFSEKKREKNVVDFSDLEHFALAILLRGENLEPTETALAYRDYFDEIMIDEYQDSNLVQEMLLSAVSRQQDKNRYNNRFMVGDIKQSIYRFRMARPEIFMEKYDSFLDIDENGTPVNPYDTNTRIDLSMNFRSRKQVIDTVNSVFYKIMEKYLGGVKYNYKHALNLGANAEEYPGQCYESELLIYEQASEWMKEEAQENEQKISLDRNVNLKEREAKMVADKINELVGIYQVYDNETGQFRKAKYKDIVILLRTTSGWDEVFKTVLNSQGIPVFVTSKTGYFSADEVQTILKLLAVINNPYNEVALASVLSSFIVGLSVNELAALSVIKEEGNLYEKLLEYEHPKCVRFLKELERFREWSDDYGIYELMNGVLSTYHYLEYVSAKPGGEQRRANVEMLLEKANSYEKTSFHGLQAFLEYMDQLQAYEVDYGEADVTDEESDVVRIMSIHKSKGLEFPICFVSGLNKTINIMDVFSPVILDVDYKMGFPFKNTKLHITKKNPLREMLAYKIKLDQLGEELRILYVAMTRAKEKLYLTASCKDLDTIRKKIDAVGFLDGKIPKMTLLNATSLLEYIWISRGIWGEDIHIYHDEDLMGNEIFYEFSTVMLKQNFERQTKEKNGDISELLNEKFSFVYPYDYLSKLYTKTSVSELKKAHIHESEETNVIFETEQTQIPYLPEYMREEKKSSGTSRGSAYHRVLELIDYKKLFQVFGSKTIYAPPDNALILDFTKAEFSRIANYEQMNEDIALVDLKKVAAFLGSESAFRMAKADANGKLYKEQPFVMAVDARELIPDLPVEEKVLIQGIIDVFFVEETKNAEEVVVLDYKTDRVDEAKELLSRYKSQLTYYGEALEKLTTLHVKEKIIYSFALGAEIKWKD